MKARMTFSIFVVVLAFTVIGAAQQSSPNQNMPTGKAFINKAAQINLGEVELGKLAEQKGNNPAIKDFGKRMVDDHTQAENELQSLATQKGVTLPSQPGSEAATLRQQLSSASGAQFDDTYLQHMLSGHKGAIETIENEIEHGQDPAIKAYAARVLPVIQDHVRIAEDVAGKLGMSGKEGLSQSSKAISASVKPK